MSGLKASRIVLPLHNEVRQQQFQQAGFDASSLNLHCFSLADRSTVFVFVHGWGGSGYKTWGRLLPILFDGVCGEGVDVATFDYVSGFRRVRGFRQVRQKRADLQFWAKQLAGHLRKLCEKYQDVYVVGHSMGGQVVEEAVRQHLTTEAFRNDGRPSSLSGLILIASPRSGTQLAVPVVGRLVREYPILRPAGRQATEVESFYSTHVERRNLASGEPGQTVLPLYAAIGGSDRVVNRFSALFGVIESQRLQLDANHMTAAKPTDADLALPRWLINDVHKSRAEVKRQSERLALHEKTRIERGIRLSEAPMVAKLVSDTSGLEWEELYQQARKDASTPELEIGDSRDHPNLSIDLVVAVNEATKVATDASLRRRTLEVLAQDRMRHASSVVGICPVGSDHEVASDMLNHDVLDYPDLTSAYIRGAADGDSLLSLLGRLLRVVLERRPDRNSVGAIASPSATEVSPFESDPTKGAAL